jgi:hypothetical protein
MSGKAIASVWLAWAVVMYVLDKRAGRPITSWVQTAVICSTVFAAAP